MKLNGAEELRLAKENNQYVNGKPYIIVVVDGGWSKRSYGHGYNASSGIVRFFLINSNFYIVSFIII